LETRSFEKGYRDFAGNRHKTCKKGPNTVLVLSFKERFGFSFGNIRLRDPSSQKAIP
jgi:hypothetical protein